MRLLVLFRGEYRPWHRRLSDHGECENTAPNVGLEPTTVSLRVSSCTAVGVGLLTERMGVQAHPRTRSSFSARSFPANNVFQKVVLMLVKNIVLLLQRS